MLDETNHSYWLADTETSGISPQDDHRIIEIGAVEIVNRRYTGRVYHQYVNPERPIDAEATRVHGIYIEDLKGYPRFEEIAPEFIQTIKGGTLVMHNAPFDVGFFNHELSKLTGYQGKTITDFVKVIDTLEDARRRFPGKKASLDALAGRFGIDTSARDFHGALVDSLLLGDVYLAMTGGQRGLELDNGDFTKSKTASTADNFLNRHAAPTPVVEAIKGDFIVRKASSEELALHQQITEKYSIAGI